MFLVKSLQNQMIIKNKLEALLIFNVNFKKYEHKFEMKNEEFQTYFDKPGPSHYYIYFLCMS